jgi:protein-S-isoprenylcysteine O-methyltransferase Ste14
MRSLGSRAALSATVTGLLGAAALFASSGTLRFWEAWAFVGQMWVVMMATNTYLLRTAPRLLERRLVSNREPKAVQRVAKGAMYATSIAMLVTAGLDRRAGWSHVPPVLVGCGFAALGAGALLVFLVLRENGHASFIVDVTDDQSVVSTGPYRLVRHPMYLGVLFQGVAAPLALGSYWAEVFAALACVVVVVRLLDEERMLEARLAGYTAYASRTRHRLVPGVW